jgi:hypothetical protein
VRIAHQIEKPPEERKSVTLPQSEPAGVGCERVRDRARVVPPAPDRIGGEVGHCLRVFKLGEEVGRCARRAGHGKAQEVAALRGLE